MTTPTREQVVQLLQCPFCGSDDIRNVSAGQAGPSTRFHAGDEIFAVNCGECGASVPNRYKNELVVGAWNRRATLARADLEAKVAELSEAKRKLIEAVADHVTVRSDQHSRIVELEAAAKADALTLVLSEARIGELEAEVELLKDSHARSVNLRQQLAASQLEVKWLRDALESMLPFAERGGHSGRKEKVWRDAINQQSDDTALREYCAAEVAKEREACAKACEKERVQIVVDGLEERAYNNAVNDCADAIRARADKIRKGEAL